MCRFVDLTWAWPPALSKNDLNREMIKTFTELGVTHK
jgi:hypothetical protein